MRVRFDVIGILALIITMGLATQVFAQEEAAGSAEMSLEEMYANFVNTPVQPVPVSLVEKETLNILSSDWLNKQKELELEALSTEREATGGGEYSKTFWIMIGAVAVLVVIPLIVSFGAMSKRISLNIKLYNSHGSLILLALLLGVSGYLYISRVSGVSGLDWDMLELNGMVNKVYVAQNNFLLYGVRDKVYGEKQIVDINKTLEEFDEDFASIKASEFISEDELQALDKMKVSLDKYKELLGYVIEANHSIENIKHETEKVVSDVNLDLTELERHFRATLDMLNMEGASYEAVQFNTLMVKHITDVGKILRRTEILKSGFLLDNKVQRIKDLEDYLGMLKGSLEVIKKGLRSEEEKSQLTNVESGVQNYIEQLQILFEDSADLNNSVSTMVDRMLEVRKITSEVSNALGVKANTLSEEANAAATVLIAMALLVGIVPTILVTRSITKPIGKVVEMLREMGSGHLERRLNLDRSDEIGQMSKTMDEFADTLQGQMVGALQKLAEGDLTFEAKLTDDNDVIMGALLKTRDDLHEIISQINASGDQIASGSAQVSDSSHSLSQTATEQASSVEQITSAMEQISSQTKLNADNAMQANQLAQHARQAADGGNTRMQDLLSAMREINEAGKNVSKIIKVIDEIAFQTNLLALNAAVEAARAGRHGKGFAVVAEEVRSLAARSAQAARETAELIEGSVSKAQNGAELADNTAKSLEEIVSEVTKVTDLVGEIASASTDQSKGIEEVNRGLGEIDKIVQQNAAIAEEGASAAEELSAQASGLKEMLARFKLSEETHLLTGETEFEEEGWDEEEEGTEEKERDEERKAEVVGSRQKPSDIINLDDDEF